MSTASVPLTSWSPPERPPRTLFDFAARFPDEESCLRYLAQVRWPRGFHCSGCGGGSCWWLGDGRLCCTGCRKKVSVRAGTIFQDSHVPLLTWFRVAWLVTNGKDGMSALSIRRALGLRRYETTWLLLHKLRRAMVRPGRDLLSGEVEVDETYVGGPAPGTRGRGTSQAIVAIAAECRAGGTMGRIRLERVPNIGAPALHDFVLDNVETGSVIYTDGLPSYRGLDKLGYEHWPTAIAQTNSPAHVVMPRVHRVASLLQRWLLGTHQGGLQVEQLDYYLDEFVFRFNRRTSRSRGSLFLRLLEQGCQVAPVTGDRIRGGHP